MKEKISHPTGLVFLFFTEMWERLGYYLMLAILLLYMTDTEMGGLEMPNDRASNIFGTFIALVYLTPFIGGMLADRWLGYRLSIIIGCILMGVGYIGLAIPGLTPFYISLGIIIIGTGFFKPNISTVLGNLYNHGQYRQLKDVGFSIFYMGINVGALLAPFIAAKMRINFGWGYAFAAAGIGMFLAAIIFAIGNKHYKHVDVRPEKKPGEANLLITLGGILLPAAIFGAITYFIPGNVFGDETTDAFIFGCVPILGYFLWLWKTAPKPEKEPIALLK